MITKSVTCSKCGADVPFERDPSRETAEIPFVYAATCSCGQFEKTLRSRSEPKFGAPARKFRIYGGRFVGGEY